MNLIKQKTAIIGCFQAANGDKFKAIEMYGHLDSAGLVSRKSNVKPRDGKDYGYILFATAKKRGWI